MQDERVRPGPEVEKIESLWLGFIDQTAGIMTTSLVYKESRSQLSREIRFYVSESLLETDETDPWRRCKLDQALDELFFKLSVSSDTHKKEHPEVAAWTQDREYWGDFVKTKKISNP